MAYILQPSLVEKKSLSPKADFAKNNRKLEFFKNLDSLLDEETCLNSDDLTRSSARHERNDVTKTSHSASLYYGDFDYYRDGRTRSLSRISEASHTSGEHDFWGDPLHPNPPPPQILDFSDFHPATKPTHPEEKCIPEAFINQNFLATPSDKQELTFTAISPPVNPHLTAPTLGDAATPSLTKLAANNSSSCNNLAVVMVPELVTLNFKSESTPELADIAKTNSSKDLHPDAEQKFLQSGNTASLPPSTNDISKLNNKNDAKRSNLKQEIQPKEKNHRPLIADVIQP
ncbi:uncharacterized protein LOC131949707 [Physella acuta]|uniref:uncharacterized protein LOC131949707 n=1 Tax=Physella acuta TaxID=109671 RepID=UPI0027DCF723|nr:uncharacterized protein LOC131949707 [Physella acuta]